MRRVFTKPVVYTLYGLSIICLALGIFMISDNGTTKTESIDPGHVYDILDRPTLPTFDKKDMLIGRPYQDEGIKVVQGYYDYKASEEEQRKALIKFQDTYLQSTGVSYQLGEDGFNVISVLAGEVVEIKTDELIGNQVRIKHSENVYSVYQSLGEIHVTQGDQIEKGTIIATSGTSNINANLKNHLYFELLIDNIYVNPEEYYDKTL
jgi:murein DD-endopeptidase MepM/ murein hydrolase activator NlpD